MVKNHNNSTGWRRALAVFSLNDPRWGRGESTDAKADQPSSAQNGKDVRNEQNRPPDDKSGRGGRESGPPDLDELWRDFNQRLNQLFGRKGGGGGRPPLDNGRPGRAGAIGVLAVLGVAILVWLGRAHF